MKLNFLMSLVMFVLCGTAYSMRNVASTALVNNPNLNACVELYNAKFSGYANSTSDAIQQCVGLVNSYNFVSELNRKSCIDLYDNKANANSKSVASDKCNSLINRYDFSRNNKSLYTCVKIYKIDVYANGLIDATNHCLELSKKVDFATNKSLLECIQKNDSGYEYARRRWDVAQMCVKAEKSL